MFLLFRLLERKPTAPKPPKHPKPAAKRVEKPKPSAPTGPMIAIVIDDLGYSMDIGGGFATSAVEFTLSVMPHAPGSARLTELARKHGKDVLMHVPMEPATPTDKLGEGALLEKMTHEEVARTLEKDLSSNRNVAGINNHMGSKFTEDAERMAVVMRVLKNRGLFFLDSRTTSGTVARKVAEEVGVKFLERGIFLDNETGTGPINGQIEKLKQKAKKDGFAVAIGHPHPETLKAIETAAPALKKDGFQIVGISKLIDSNKIQ
jgi:polysaccharide deacetylase 2 family uncharacterized protein YibQ